MVVTIRVFAEFVDENRNGNGGFWDEWNRMG